MGCHPLSLWRKPVRNLRYRRSAKSKAQRAKNMGSQHEEDKRHAKRPHWRFEDLEIWQSASQLAVKFHRIADVLEELRMYRYAEQLRSAGLSPSNNIAEGSGSHHKRKFIQFLNIARRSLFEDASILLVFEKLSLVNSEEIDDLLTDCDGLSRKITNFVRTL